MKAALFLTGIFALVSCASLPEIRPGLPGPAGKVLDCPSPFLTEKTRLIHAIEARAAGAAQGAVIGVTLADPQTRQMSCAIMSAEGLVLFEADAGPSGLKVSRALPPFDAPDFARNMMDDIELIYFPPPGAPEQRGFSADGLKVCRWRQDTGGWIDVTAGPAGSAQIRRYSRTRALMRRVQLDASAAGPYGRIELVATQWVGYSLTMTLIEAEPVLPQAGTGGNTGKGRHP